MALIMSSMREQKRTGKASQTEYCHGREDMVNALLQCQLQIVKSTRAYVLPYGWIEERINVVCVQKLKGMRELDVEQGAIDGDADGTPHSPGELDGRGDDAPLLPARGILRRQ